MSGHEPIGGEVELSRQETIALADAERVIEGGMKTFIEVGMALGYVREHRLYRADYETFEEYCAARWGFTGRRGRQLIEAAEIGTVVPVKNEGQARELARVPEEERESVLAEARQRGKVTAEKIREVAVERGHVEASARRDSEASDPASSVATTGGPDHETPGLVGDVPSTAPPAGPGPDGTCFPEASASPTETPGPTGAAHRPPADPGANDRPVDEATPASTLSAHDPRADGDSGRAFAGPDAGDGDGRDGDGAADPSRPDTGNLADVTDLRELVWLVLDVHGNRPYGLTVAEIWTKVPGSVHSSRIQPVLDELAAGKRAIVMGASDGVARWLNVRRCEDCGNTATELFDNRCGNCDALAKGAAYRAETGTTVAQPRADVRSRVEQVTQDAEDLGKLADRLESQLQDSHTAEELGLVEELTQVVGDLAKAVAAPGLRETAWLTPLRRCRSELDRIISALEEVPA